MYALIIKRLRKRYLHTIANHEPGLVTAQRLAVFIGLCFTYRIWPEQIWITTREVANLLLYCLRKAEMFDQYESLKKQIYDSYDRFEELRFTDLWVMVSPIFPEIKFEKLNHTQTYKQIVSNSKNI